ncbi:MAG: palindromic element RPE4 domain-containing protein [Gammaproteobacteria bacterium]
MTAGSSFETNCFLDPAVKPRDDNFLFTLITHHSINFL